MNKNLQLYIIIEGFLVKNNRHPLLQQKNGYADFKVGISVIFTEENLYLSYICFKASSTDGTKVKAVVKSFFPTRFT